MDKSILVRTFGFPATLIHGDTLVLDRWRWLRARLPRTAGGEKLLDVGCGTGAFTIGAARRGYQATGISWDQRNQATAAARASLCSAPKANFVIGDVRRLNELDNLDGPYDVAICMECVEHIWDDRKLFQGISERLIPGGRLLLSTPHYFYRPMSKGELGPYFPEETGDHVRRGYTPTMLRELCERSGLVCDAVSYCSGLLSQKTTVIQRWTQRFLPHGPAWAVGAPLRLVPALLPDRLLTRVLEYPFYSICLEASKPRFGNG